MAPTNVDTMSSANASAQIGSGDSGKKSSRIFYEALVHDFIPSISSIDPEELQKKLFNAKTVTNPKWLSGAPRNSVIATVVSDGEGKASTGPQVFYPFFSHMSLPVKPGEIVWVMFPKGDGQNPEGYWLTRSIGQDLAEDVNYTHKSRATLPLDSQSSETSAMTAMEGQDQTQSFNPLGFPPGGVRSATDNLLQSATWPKETITESSTYAVQFTPEPVPRFSKRSPDLSLQGSNNTLICLGEDRGRTSESTDESSLETDISSFGKGAIDIVAGRSIYASGGKTIFDPDLANPIGSAPFNTTLPSAIGENTREDREIDKAPDKTGNSTESNPLEGDPDFVNDLSRLYISMKTNGDSNFSLEYPDVSPHGETPIAVDESPYIITKSNEIRIIARKNEDQEVNGSIRIVKEGTEDEDKAVIMMLSDGTIMIDGPKIVIGSGIESANGEGDHIFIGRDATESIVLGDTFNEKLLAFLDAIVTAAPALVSTGVGPGVINPDLLTATTTLITELRVTKSNLSKIGKTK